MILNSLFPVFSLVILGIVLKRFNLTDDAFLNTSDRLIYFIFFPAMLFWKIGGSPHSTVFDSNYLKAAFCALFFLYIISCIYIKIFKVPAFKAGSFSQSCYRFNTYIGMAIVMNVTGEAGLKLFGILIGFIIPTINILAVSTLIWFSKKTYTFKTRFFMILKSIISNPLIIACIAGIFYSRFINTFPGYIDNAFRLMSLATLPLALISIGGALTFKGLKGNLLLSIASSTLKLVIFPIVGLYFMRFFNVTGIFFKVSMIFFALPTSTAIYVLSSQLNSDTKLASASIVFSTIFSFFSLTAVLLFL